MSTAKRHQKNSFWRFQFQLIIFITILTLSTLLYNILDQTFGLIALENKIDPTTLSAQPLEDLEKKELFLILESHLSNGLMRRYESEIPFSDRSQTNLYLLVLERVVEPTIVDSWNLTESILHHDEIIAATAIKYPAATVQYHSWLSYQFLITPQSSRPEIAGIQTAIFGSLWIIFITIIFSVPIGLGTAVYLEEYAPQNWFTSLISLNINNLAGVPSIIYGMLGLAIFVRLLESLTSGVIFGLNDSGSTNGRTILSAGLTLGLLILPIIIINSREAIRAVPPSLRLASYGLGATKWQTIWHHILPSALPGILTGTILSVSRAIGETAPLVVIGAATFITINPNSPFSEFTTLPIQIYQWTSRPQEEFHHLAAAAIVILLLILLSLNGIAVWLRNYYSRKLS